MEPPYKVGDMRDKHDKHINSIPYDGGVMVINSDFHGALWCYNTGVERHQQTVTDGYPG